jgi:hypothetical protein
MFLFLQLTGDWHRDDVATLTIKREVLKVEGKVSLRQIVNGKMKADVCWEFGLVNSRSRRFGEGEVY